MSWHRRSRTIAAVTAIVFTAGLTSTSPALAAAPSHLSPGVSLSSNGSVWAPDLTSPLFDPGTRWVPGDRRQASFFVRNDGEADAELAVTIRAEDSNGLIAGNAVDLTVSTPHRPGAAPPAGTPTTLGRLARGSAERIDIAAVFHGAATNATMRKLLRFTVVVDLAGTPTGATNATSATGQVSEGRPPNEADPAPRTGLLAYTGSEQLWALLVVGLTALAIGLATLIRRASARRIATRRNGARP